MLKQKSLISILTVLILAFASSVIAENVKESKGKENEMNSETTLTGFMRKYQRERGELAKAANLAQWNAYISGKEEDFDQASADILAFSAYHSDPAKYALFKKLKEESGNLDKIEARAVEVALLEFESNQLPEELLKEMTEKSSEIEQVFQTFRGTLDGKEYTNNELLEMLAKETDSGKRKAIWESLKQVGEVVAPKLIELAKTRNKAAKSLGFDNYWRMQVHFQEHNPEQLLAIFDELEKTTAPIFTKMKADLDGELAEKFGISPAEMMPWHYDNPFFQQAPPSKDVDPCDFYKNYKKEDIVEFSVNYYTKLGLPVKNILQKSDLYEKPGKSQHAFSFDIDAPRDVRILCNIKPTDDWMDTQLHELGHAVYAEGLDPDLPNNIRDSAHIFTTEGVAMFFGAKARTPLWMIEFAKADPEKVNAVADALKQQRRREQLLFARWCIVMLHFEKALYENPDADLNTLWWDTVEKYQQLKRPEGRNLADWASKPHFAIAPVYYHNYQLGELFAAQMRKTLGPLSDKADPALGKFMKEKVFFPGASMAWPEFVEKACGEPLSAEAFAKELE